MRTKVLLCAAALAASLATSMADTNVYSINVVGYVNKTVKANIWYLWGNPLNASPDNTTKNVQILCGPCNLQKGATQGI